MKRPGRLQHRVLAPLLILAGGCAQPGAPALTDAQRAAIADTVRQHAAALYEDENRRSAEVFVAQMADGPDLFTYASTGRVFWAKDSLAKAARTRVASLRALTYTLRDARVLVLGPDAAVLTGSYGEAATDSTGKELAFNDAWTAVYQRRDGKWQIVHGHFSRSPTP